jgi:FkbM family methyltransferase
MKRVLARLHRRSRRKRFERFLSDAAGVIHVGAHTGQERDLYARHGLAVLWIEPLEELFAELSRNIAPYPSQRAVLALVTDRDGVEHEFNVASNAGASSSILELGLHSEVWPEVRYVDTRRLISKTLPTLLAEHGLDPSAYDAIVVDTQGADLLVLKGAEPLLGGFRYVQVEAPDFEAYLGCGHAADVADFLGALGFEEMARRTIGRHAAGGRYYDLLFAKRGQTPFSSEEGV